MAHGPALRAQDSVLSLAGFERWTLYWDFDEAKPRAYSKSALLVLLVRNDANRLLLDWKAIVLVRDSAARELFRVAVAQDSADLAPGEVQRAELQFENDLNRDGEPYDHLMEHDTTNLRVALEEVRASLGPPVGCVRAGAPVCFTREAFAALAAARGDPNPAVYAQTLARTRDCQLLVRDTPVALLQPMDDGWLVRIKRMQRTGWVFGEDVRREK